MNRTGAPGIKGRSTLPGDGLRERVQSESFRMKNREGAIAIPGAIKWTRVFFFGEEAEWPGPLGPDVAPSRTPENVHMHFPPRSEKGFPHMRFPPHAKISDRGGKGL